MHDHIITRATKKLTWKQSMISEVSLEASFTVIAFKKDENKMCLGKARELSH